MLPDNDRKRKESLYMGKSRDNDRMMKESPYMEMSRNNDQKRRAYK